MRLLLPAAALLILVATLPTPVLAQHRAPVPETLFSPAPTGAEQLEFARPSVSSITASARPRWLRWGLIGAGVGAATFAALGRMTVDSQPNPVLQDAALGAVSGFVILGGSIALYDAVCAPASSSRRSGLC